MSLERNEQGEKKKIKIYDGKGKNSREIIERK